LALVSPISSILCADAEERKPIQILLTNVNIFDNHLYKEKNK
jgi:hypothetical protein